MHAAGLPALLKVVVEGIGLCRGVHGVRKTLPLGVGVNLWPGKSDEHTYSQLQAKLELVSCPDTSEERKKVLVPSKTYTSTVLATVANTIEWKNLACINIRLLNFHVVLFLLLRHTRSVALLVEVRC